MRYKNSPIRKRKNGTFEIRYRKNGVEKSVYGKTLNQVKVKFKEWYDLNVETQPKRLQKSSSTVEDWIIRYLEIYKKPYVSQKTFYENKLKIYKYIVPLIGNRDIKTIKNEDIQKVLNAAVYNGKPQNKVYTIIKEIFKLAKYNHIISDNPAEMVKFKKAKDKNAAALTTEEQEAFKNAIAGSVYEKFYLYLLYTGCRRQEGLNLRLSDIEDGKIHIRGTKTEKSDRFIPLFDNVRELLKDCSENPVFPFSAATVTRHFSKFCPGHKLRDLRKTFSTNCQNAGVSPKTVQKWLGHTTISMTLNTYTDVLPDIEKKEAEKLNVSASSLPQTYPTPRDTVQ